MRSIYMSDGMVYATNNHDGGVFARRSADSSYRQWAGNSQTPYFRSPNHFRTYLRRRFNVRGVRMVDKYW